MALLDRADAQDAFRELGMLPQQFALERVALLSRHRRNVERIIRNGDVLNSLLRPELAFGPGRLMSLAGVRGRTRATG